MTIGRAALTSSSALRVLSGPRGNVAAFAALVAASLFVYRDALVGIPRADHFWLMEHRSLAESDWQFFLNTLAYNRTRTIAAGDFYVFRPLMTGSLGLVDLLWRHDLYVRGTLSVLCHALCCFVLFLLLKHAGPSRLKWVLLPHFAIQYSGIDLILWRHVSPYILGLVWFGLGLHQLIGYGDRDTFRSSRVAAGCFLVAGLFHEAMVLFLVLVAPLCWLRAEDRRIGAAFAAAPLLYVSMNLGVAAYYDVSGFWNSDDRGWSLSVVPLMSASLWTAGATVAAFLSPWSAVFRFQFADRTWWDFTQLGSPLVLGAGGLGVVGMAVLVLKAIRSRTLVSNGQELVRFIALGTLATLLAGIAYARVYQRGLYYLMMSPYNFYLTNFLLCVVVARVVSVPLEGTRAVGRRLVAGYLLVSSLVTYGRLTDGVRAASTRDLMVADLNLAVYQALADDESLCFDGLQGEALEGIVLPILQYEVSCKVRGSRPMLATVDDDGVPRLIPRGAVSRSSGVPLRSP